MLLDVVYTQNCGVTLRIPIISGQGADIGKKNIALHTHVATHHRPSECSVRSFSEPGIRSASAQPSISGARRSIARCKEAQPSRTAEPLHCSRTRGADLRKV